MDHRNPAHASVCQTAPDDVALIAALEGDDHGEVAAHLAACPACQERASTLAALETALRARLFRACCPSSEQLAAYLMDRVSHPERLALIGHIRTCPHCTRDLGVLRHVLTPLRTPEQRAIGDLPRPLTVHA